MPAGEEGIHIRECVCGEEGRDGGRDRGEVEGRGVKRSRWEEVR